LSEILYENYKFMQDPTHVLIYVQQLR